jgi:hypothetical protein
VSALSLPFERLHPLHPLARRSFPGRTTLTRRDRETVRAIAEAMFAQDGEVDGARLDAHVVEVDAYVSAASRPVRAGLRLALFVVHVAPLLLFARLRTLEQLPIDERAAILSRLERSRLAPLSLAFIGWRTVMTLIFYEHPAELRAIGYAGEGRARHARHLALAQAPPIPAPVESGVRLREPDAAEKAAEKAAEAAAPASAAREVA